MARPKKEFSDDDKQCQRDLLWAAQSGDQKALELLLRQNRGLFLLALRQAFPRYTGKVPVQEYLGEATLAFLRAVMQWDAVRGEFSTYVVTAMRRRIRRQWRQERLLVTVHEAASDCWQELPARRRRSAEQQRAARRVLRHNRRAARRARRSNFWRPYAEWSGLSQATHWNGKLYFRRESDPGPTPPRSMPEMEQALRILSPRAQQIIELRFYQGKLLEEIAAVLKVTRERVRQLEAQAIRKLQTQASFGSWPRCYRPTPHEATDARIRLQKSLADAGPAGGGSPGAGDLGVVAESAGLE